MAVKTHRVFTSVDKNGNEVTLRFVRPNQALIAKGDLKYREAYSRAFRAGVLVNAEVMKVMRERGLWDDSRDEEILKIRDEITKLESNLKDQSLSNEAGEELVKEIRRLRSELALANSVYTTVVDNTCESIGNEARNQFFAASCVVDAKSGAKIFKDADDFVARLDEAVALDSYREAVIAGLEDQLNVELPSDLTSHYPENQWLKSREKTADVEEEPKAEEEQKPKRGKKSTG